MKRQAIKKLYHCVFSLNYHLVLVTKYRHKCINDAISQRLQEIIKNLCSRWKGQLIEFNATSDHAHMLVSLPPTLQLSTFVNNVKTVTARRIRKEFSAHLAPFYWKPVFWSRTYCILACGGAPLAIIKQYIENQKD